MSSKLLALNINNLTEARYFSAMMVDFLHFHISHEDPASNGIDYTSFLGLSEWIEGPKIICSFDNDVPQNIITKIQALSSFGGTLQAGKLVLDTDRFILCNGADSQSPTSEFWLIHSTEDLQAAPPEPAGYALSASGESEVGIKDFEHFDKIFDLINSEHV